MRNDRMIVMGGFVVGAANLQGGAITEATSSFAHEVNVDAR
ncbi:hypothetical protein Poly41_54760 [Novipirellula artificiosorum]|uniref:Uncharacterized protein n=1 Tax=Novipirellula artificiosorum TaxID=2528016 RepID=A0A5C6D6P1_9BACT|nr:hypothetical protein Poly41_54760 [Novipirellula artificiosorum]